MRSASLARRNRRRFGYFALGVGLFIVIASTILSEPSREQQTRSGLFAASAIAGPSRADLGVPLFEKQVEFASASSAGPGSSANGGPRPAILLALAAVVSALSVLNVGFLGHLRRVYASPRRAGARSSRRR